MHAVGKDAHHAQHVGPGVPQRLHHADDAAAGGDQVLNDHHALARLQPALDLILAAVILAAGADISHGQTQNMAGNGGVGDAGGGGAHQHLRCGIELAHGVGNGLLHLIAHLRRGEDQAVVTVNGAFDAAGPEKRLLRPEKNGSDGEQAAGDGVANVHKMILLS